MAATRSMLVLPLLALALVAAPDAAAKNPAAKWLQSVPSRHYANLLVIAGLTKAAAGFNFDGYAKGRLTVTVPAGWTMHVVFRNAGALPHSLMVVPWSTKASATHPKPAFAGATTPVPYQGTQKGGHSQFNFRTLKPGKYRLICAVPGHDAAGMWDTLVIKRGAKAATATT